MEALRLKRKFLNPLRAGIMVDILLSPVACVKQILIELIEN